jgi:hypothetical protein
MKEYKELLKRPRTLTPSPRYSSLILPSSPGFATPPPRTPTHEDWVDWPTPLTLRTRKRGVNYIKSRTMQLMNGIPITPSVLRVQEKVEAALERSILAGALAR